MKYYKLTDEHGETQNNTKWGENITHKATRDGKEMCTRDVIHVYDHPLKAVMFNIIHAGFRSPKLWRCRVKRVVANDYLKVGVKSCTTIKEIPLPEITIKQRVRFAIYCALEVYSDDGFVKWANDWLNGKDLERSAAAAARSAESAESAARSAALAESAVWSAAAAARSAARSATTIDFVKLIKKAMDS